MDTSRLYVDENYTKRILSRRYAHNEYMFFCNFYDYVFKHDF